MALSNTVKFWITTCVLKHSPRLQRRIASLFFILTFKSKIPFLVCTLTSRNFHSFNNYQWLCKHLLCAEKRSPLVEETDTWSPEQCDKIKSKDVYEVTRATEAGGEGQVSRRSWQLSRVGLEGSCRWEKEGEDGGAPPQHTLRWIFVNTWGEIRCLSMRGLPVCVLTFLKVFSVSQCIPQAGKETSRPKKCRKQSKGIVLKLHKNQIETEWALEFSIPSTST